MLHQQLFCDGGVQRTTFLVLSQMRQTYHWKISEPSTIQIGMGKSGPSPVHNHAPRFGSSSTLGLSPNRHDRTTESFYGVFDFQRAMMAYPSALLQKWQKKPSKCYFLACARSRECRPFTAWASTFVRGSSSKSTALAHHKWTRSDRSTWVRSPFMDLTLVWFSISNLVSRTATKYPDQTRFSSGLVPACLHIPSLTEVLFLHWRQLCDSPKSVPEKAYFQLLSSFAEFFMPKTIKGNSQKKWKTTEVWMSWVEIYEAFVEQFKLRDWPKVGLISNGIT